MAQIAEIIAAGSEVNCTILAEQFETSTKTIQRDFDCLRDRMGFDLEYNPKKHVYRLGGTSPTMAAFLKLAAPSQIAARRQAANWMQEAA